MTHQTPGDISWMSRHFGRQVDAESETLSLYKLDLLRLYIRHRYMSETARGKHLVLLDVYEIGS